MYFVGIFFDIPVIMIKTKDATALKNILYSILYSNPGNTYVFGNMKSSVVEEPFPRISGDSAITTITSRDFQLSIIGNNRFNVIIKEVNKTKND